MIKERKRKGNCSLTLDLQIPEKRVATLSEKSFSISSLCSSSSSLESYSEANFPIPKGQNAYFEDFLIPTTPGGKPQVFFFAWVMISAINFSNP